jgi:hypothetical protein
MYGMALLLPTQRVQAEKACAAQQQLLHKRLSWQAPEAKTSCAAGMGQTVLTLPLWPRKDAT